MKKRFGKGVWILVMMVLLFSFMGGMASAEECGYWTEQIDEEGRVVRIFTYTEPVVITEIEGEPMEDELPASAEAAQADDEPAQLMEVPVYLSGGAGPVEATQTTGITAGMIVLGVLSLAGMAFVLYKAI